ncbi:MAG: glycosyltransferase family A protein [bacterium]
MPKYSIIIATYNRADYLRQVVDSVLGQTYRDFELVVYDDGSTDDTQSVLKSYGDRLRTQRGSNKGIGAATNAALAMAQGTYVSIIGSDDFWMPWTLEQVDKVVEAVEQPAGVYLYPTYFMGDNVPKQPADPSPVSYRVFNSYAEAPPSVPDGSGMLGAIPRQLLVSAQGFWEYRYSGCDTDLILRLSRKMRYVCMDAPTTVYVREHAGRTMRLMQPRFEGVKQMLNHFHNGLYGHGANDPLVAKRIVRFGISVSLHLTKQFGAWRESADLFRQTVHILPRRNRLGLSLWYGGYLTAIMTSRLLEQVGQHCARRLSGPWSDPTLNTPGA